MSENGNIIDFPFARSADHPDIAKETKAFCLPHSNPIFSHDPRIKCCYDCWHNPWHYTR